MNDCMIILFSSTLKGKNIFYKINNWVGNFHWKQDISMKPILRKFFSLPKDMEVKNTRPPWCEKNYNYKNTKIHLNIYIFSDEKCLVGTLWYFRLKKSMADVCLVCFLKYLNGEFPGLPRSLKIPYSWNF